jgi:hypothetical protein
MYKKIFFSLAAGFLMATGCIKEDLPFEVAESPVLAMFAPDRAAPGNVVRLTATFMELDKSGILDKNKGIDSLPVANLPVSVYIFENQLIGNYTTDAKGNVVFDKAKTDLKGATRLEWVGEHKKVKFRIYRPL